MFFERNSSFLAFFACCLCADPRLTKDFFGGKWNTYFSIICWNLFFKRPPPSPFLIVVIFQALKIAPSFRLKRRSSENVVTIFFDSPK